MNGVGRKIVEQLVPNVHGPDSLSSLSTLIELAQRESGLYLHHDKFMGPQRCH